MSKIQENWYEVTGTVADNTVQATGRNSPPQSTVKYHHYVTVTQTQMKPIIRSASQKNDNFT